MGIVSREVVTWQHRLSKEFLEDRKCALWLQNNWTFLNEFLKRFLKLKHFGSKNFCSVFLIQISTKYTQCSISWFLSHWNSSIKTSYLSSFIHYLISIRSKERHTSNRKNFSSQISSNKDQAPSKFYFNSAYLKTKSQKYKNTKAKNKISNSMVLIQSSTS